MTKDDKAGGGQREPTELWCDLVDLMAEAEAEAGEPTEADLAWSASVDGMVKAKLAEMRRQLTPGEVPIQRGVTIPPEVEAMDRAALIEQLDSLRVAGLLRYAHQDLIGLTDQGLRNMLVVYMQMRR